MRTFQIKPVPEFVNWSRRRMISTTRASICPAISMIAVSGSVRVCSSKRRSKKRTCKYVRRTWARKSRSKGLFAHCFRVVSSRKVAGRACQCSSAFCWMILVEAVNFLTLSGPEICLPCFLGNRRILLILEQFPNFLFQGGTYRRPTCIGSIARLGLRVPAMIATV